MKYAHIENKTNKLLGWYDKEVYTKIPTPNIEVEEKVWQEAININANCYENGKFIVKDFRTNEEIKQAEYETWKQERQNKVDNLEVTYNEVVYQGDELSQARVSRAIAVMNDTETTQWVAKDNSIQILNKADLSAILKEAGTKQTKIWNEGRPQ